MNPSPDALMLTIVKGGLLLGVLSSCQLLLADHSGMDPCGSSKLALITDAAQV